MKILHIIKSRQTELTKKIIEQQSKKHDVRVIDIKKKDISFEDVIDEIFSYDKVISW
ncbi:MAG: hypothetical protein Q8N09_02940 [Thermodesulfovibrionia bacterium]|nr:hypothetical protein [Thermodesulfovibrionia bacterium]